MRYRVLVEPDENGVFVATVPSLPGCIADGPTRSAALAGVKNAIALYVESLEEHGDPVPPPITEEMVEVRPWVSYLRLGTCCGQGPRLIGVRVRPADL